MSRGIDSVTHRAVASEAGLPLASTTYYFANADELLAEGARLVARDWLHWAEREVEAVPKRRRAARLTAQMCVKLALGEAAEPESLLWRCEMYVEALRHSALRRVIVESNTDLEKLLTATLSRCGFRAGRADARVVLMAIDGAVLHAIAARANPAGTALAVVVRLVSALPRA